MTTVSVMVMELESLKEATIRSVISSALDYEGEDTRTVLLETRESSKPILTSFCRN